MRPFGRHPDRISALGFGGHHLGDAEAARKAVDQFMRAVVANFGNEWEMTSSDPDRALAALGPGKAVA